MSDMREIGNLSDSDIIDSINNLRLEVHSLNMLDNWRDHDGWGRVDKLNSKLERLNVVAKERGLPIPPLSRDMYVM